MSKQTHYVLNIILYNLAPTMHLFKFCLSSNHYNILTTTSDNIFVVTELVIANDTFISLLRMSANFSNYKSYVAFCFDHVVQKKNPHIYVH